MAVILGIDPGSRITGYGLVKTSDRRIEYLSSGCIRVTGNSVAEKLQQIFTDVSSLMQQFIPSEVAVESVFMHHNPQAALKLGQARGAAIVAAAQYEVEVAEYAARQVKQAVVGYGAAKKDQVQHMVSQILNLTAHPPEDAADALAVAICHVHMLRGLASVPGIKRTSRRRMK